MPYTEEEKSRDILMLGESRSRYNTIRLAIEPALGHPAQSLIEGRLVKAWEALYEQLMDLEQVIRDGEAIMRRGGN